MIKNKKLKLGIMALALAGLLLTSIPVNATNQAASANSASSVTSEVRDLGWTTYASSQRNLTISHSFNSSEFFNDTMPGNMSNTYTFTHEFTLKHIWNMSLAAGTYLPVNLTVEYPDTVTPGENATIRIGVERLLGYAFMNLTGLHLLEMSNHFEEYYNDTYFQNQAVLDIYLQAIHQIMAGYMLQFRTPIGSFVKRYNDVVRKIGTFNITLRFYHNDTMNNDTFAENVTASASLSTYLSFDAIVIVNTTVIGNVVINGTALDHEQNVTLVWDNEGVKDITIRVKDDAKENDTIKARVQLKYVVNDFKIIFENVTFGVKVNEVSIESQIDSNINDTGLREWARMRIRELIRNYVNGTHKLMIRVKETVMHHGGEDIGTLETTETNTLVSESPYTELTALSVSPTIIVSESTTSTGSGTSSGEESSTTGGLLSRPIGKIAIAISIVAAMTVGIYILVVRRRNNHY